MAGTLSKKYSALFLDELCVIWKHEISTGPSSKPVRVKSILFQGNRHVLIRFYFTECTSKASLSTLAFLQNLTITIRLIPNYITGLHPIVHFIPAEFANNIPSNSAQQLFNGKSTAMYRIFFLSKVFSSKVRDFSMRSELWDFALLNTIIERGNIARFGNVEAETRVRWRENDKNFVSFTFFAILPEFFT